MKPLLLLALLSVLPLQSFAVKYNDLDKNVVYACGAPGKKNAVYILSDNYTTTGRAGAGSPSKLQEDPGQLYTIVAGPQLNRTNYSPFATIFEKITPLSQVQRSSRFDKAQGVYLNQNYRLDIQGRTDSQIELQDLNDGTRYVCYAQGDCC